MRRISTSIVDYYIKKNIITEEMKSIYEYGIELLLNDIISFSVILFMSAVFGNILTGIVFSTVFYFTRLRCGGFHAKNIWICRLTMIVTFASIIISYKIIEYYNLNWIVYMLNVIAASVLLPIIPIENPNKPLDKKTKQKNRGLGTVTVILFCILSIIFIKINIQEGIVISLTICAIAFLAILGKVINNKGGENDEEKILKKSIVNDG